METKWTIFHPQVMREEEAPSKKGITSLQDEITNVHDELRGEWTKDAKVKTKWTIFINLKYSVIIFACKNVDSHAFRLL